MTSQGLRMCETSLTPVVRYWDRGQRRYANVSTCYGIHNVGNHIK